MQTNKQYKKIITEKSSELNLLSSHHLHTFKNNRQQVLEQCAKKIIRDVRKDERKKTKI